MAEFTSRLDTPTETAGPNRRRADETTHRAALTFLALLRRHFGDSERLLCHQDVDMDVDNARPRPHGDAVPRQFNCFDFSPAIW